MSEKIMQITLFFKMNYLHNSDFIRLSFSLFDEDLSSETMRSI